MDHSSNILNKTRCLLSDFLFIIGQRLTYQGSPSRFKKPRATSEPEVGSSSSLHGDPTINLELRKNHPLFVKYYFSPFKREVKIHGKKKYH
jgi:hypothetical protein